MALTVREYTDADEAAVRAIWNIAFTGGRPPQRETALVGDDDTGIVAEQDGRVVAALKYYSMTASRGQADLPCAGVAAVAVAPECRQSGVGRAMLQWTLNHLRERHMPLSSLYAFQESYYRNLGWESTGTRLGITCPNHRLPRLESGLPIRQLEADDWPALESAYRTFARRYAGMNLRTPARWLKVLTRPDPPPLIYAAGDPVEAYALVQIPSQFWSELTVLELVWGTARGYRSALAALSGLAINQASMSWSEPADGPFLASSWDRDITAELVPPVMFRAVDVSAALAALKPESSGELTLEVVDRQVPANRGPWRVRFSSDGVAVEPCGSAHLTLNVRHFSQALVGEPSFRQLLEQGFVTAASSEASRNAARLLPPQRAYCVDFF